MSSPSLIALRRALRSVGPDGRFAPADAPAVREAVAHLLREGAAASDPADLFGAWDDLGDPLQAAFRSLAEQDIRRSMNWHPRGRVWPAAVRGLNSLDGALYRAGRFARLRGEVVRTSGRLWAGPRRARERAWLAKGRWGFRRDRPTDLAGLLATLGRLPRWLTGDYVTDVDVDPRCRIFFHDPGRNVVFGLLVGFDFIPAPSGVWCVEANPGTGLIGSPDPQGFDPDPVVAGIFDLARDLGMRRVLWMGSDTIRVWPRTLEALARCAHDTGLDLDVRDDPRLPRRYDLPAGRAPRRRPAGAPDDVPDDTLVVGHNEYAIGPDHVLSDKELFIRSMAGAPEGVGESPVRVPPMTRLPPPLPSGSDPNLPNLVYKFPDSSQGRGVFFMRVRDAAQAIIIARALDREHGEPPGLFQPFVLSSLLPGRRIYDVRAHAFLSPVGCRYLGGQRRESVRTLPDRLEEGLVQQRVAFTSNISQGNLRADIPADEEPRIAAAASAAAETIAGILKRGFRTTPR